MTEKESMTRFGENLKDVLDDCFMTQTELAEVTGLSKSTISLYIKGERMPTLKSILNIIYATDCEFDDLIDFYGKVE